MGIQPRLSTITGKCGNIQEGIYIPHQSKDASPHSPMNFLEMLTVVGSPPLHRVAVSVLILCGLLICVVTLLACHCLDLACSSLIDTTLVPCPANWLLSTAIHGGAKAPSVDMSVLASQLWVLDSWRTKLPNTCFSFAFLFLWKVIALLGIDTSEMAVSYT